MKLKFSTLSHCLLHSSKKMEDWCKSTSLNGINELWEAKETRNKPKFIFWSIIMVLMLAMTILLTIININSFIESPIITKSSTIPNNSLEMPEIMLCYKGGVINRVNMLNNYGMSPELTDALAAGTIERLDHLNYSALKIEYANLLAKNNMTTAQFYNRVATLPCEEIVAYKQNPGNNNNTKCLHVSNCVGVFGNPCLIFRQNGQQVYPGNQAGVIIRVNSPKAENLPSDTLQEVKKVTLTLEINKEIDVPTHQFVEIPILNKVTVLFSLTIYNRIRKCSEEFLLSSSCFRRCHQKARLKYINCTTVGWPTTDFGSDMCNVIDHHLKWPSYGEKANKEAISCSHDCQPLCKEYDYYFTTSFFPVANDKNVTEISMSFREMMYTKIDEVESFTWDVAVANVGGQAGLWMGCSVITIIQALFHLWAFFNKKQRQETRQEDKEL